MNGTSCGGSCQDAEARGEVWISGFERSCGRGAVSGTVRQNRRGQSGATRGTLDEVGGLGSKLRRQEFELFVKG